MQQNPLKSRKLIIFGAGKIGRSFIGQLFAHSGYEVVFVDIDRKLINELNRRGQYRVIIKGNEHQETISVKNVRGIHISEEERIKEEVIRAGILAVSVGVQNLSAIIPLVARSLNARHQTFPGSPIDIIIGENMRHGAKYVHDELSKSLDKEFPLNEYVGLVETSIGKMVPIMTKKEEEEDTLLVFAEPYNNLIVDKKGFKNALPDVIGLDPKENIKAWVDRKLFIHNLGHATAAYVGYLYNPDFIYIYEALSVPRIKSFVLDTMFEAAIILLKMYPDDFTYTGLEEHIIELVYRFENKHLKDTIYRVGKDLFRKLGPEDRLAGIINAGHSRQLHTDRILLSLVCGMFFRATDEQGRLNKNDLSFISYFNTGIDHILKNVCAFDPGLHREIFQTARKYFQELHEDPKNIFKYI